MLYLLLVVSMYGSLRTAFSAHFVQGVRAIVERSFPPGDIMLISFPAAANESNQRTRQLRYRLENQFSDPRIEHDLLQDLNEQQQWTIDMHRPGSIIDDNYSYGYKYHSYLILSRTDTKELADRLTYLQSIESWNSRGRFLVFMLGNIFETSQQELLFSVRDTFWNLCEVSDILVLVPILVSGSHDSSKNAVPLYAFDGYSWYPYSSRTQCFDSLDVVHVDRKSVV